MAKIPERNNTTIAKIDGKIIENNNPRPYLGMSSIGTACMRKLWYGFRWARATEHTARTERIFQVGHFYEEEMIKDLKSVGVKFIDSQTEYSDVTGHFKGHSDGLIIGVSEAPKSKHIFEAKTHNDKSFKSVKKDGVEKSKPLHYAQCQIYMKYQKVKRAYYMAYNKNTSEYYCERIYYDANYADDLERKAHGIILSENPPEKEFAKTWYECKWCNYYDICHNSDRDIRKTCRTCQHIDILNDGKWSCAKLDRELSYDQQLRGCDLYVCCI